MKKTIGRILFTALLMMAGNLYAQEQPPDTLPMFKADSIKAVYIFADTGTALNKIDNKGIKQGLWEKRYPDGNIMYRGHFWNNHPYGVFKNYYDMGDSLQIIRVFSDDGTESYSHLFYTTGALAAEGKYVNQLKDSIWKFYDESQRLRRKDMYKNGKLEGKSVFFYPSGNIMQVKTYVDDSEEGPYQQFFDEGGVKEEGTFGHGMLQDTLTVFEPDGKVAAKCFYVNDVKEGNLVYYNNGQPKDTLIYKHGRCINSAKYTPSKKQEDALKIKYQKLQEELEHPASLEDEYKQPGGEESKLLEDYKFCN